MEQVNGNNQPTLKSVNQSAIRKVIYHHGPISRQEIADRLSLTLPTITTTVTKLIALGLVREVSTASRAAKTPGRKTQLIDIVEDSRLFLGIEMRGATRRIVITSYRGTVLARISDDREYGDYPRLLKATCELTETLLDNAGLSRERIAGIGIGVPGVVDSDAGVLMAFPEQGWERKDICGDFRELLGYDGPIRLENNACARTYGAYMFHKEYLEQSDYFAHLLVAEGIACPLMDTHIQSAHPVVGVGEIGHMVVSPEGRLCRCGNRGCLEAYASDRAILQQCRELPPQRAPILSGLVSRGSLTMETVLQAQELGDEAVCALLDTAVDKLGIAIANVLNFAGSQRLLVECKYMASPRNQRRLLEMVDAHLYKKFPTLSQIIFLPEDDCCGALGAAAVAAYRDLQTFVE